MGKIFKFLGQSVAVVKSTDTPWGRRPLFEADVTYLTAQTLCFTYLQDNTALFKQAVVGTLLLRSCRLHDHTSPVINIHSYL